METKYPVLVHVPHSATYIPNEELQYFITSDLKRELLLMTDHHCDDLFTSECEMICFPISRLVCDPERFRNDENEIMAQLGMSAVYTSCSDGSELKQVPMQHKEEILTKYYDKHHQILEDATEKILELHDKCLIIDGHSFHNMPLPYEINQNRNRPDICIGMDDFHTPERIKNLIYDFFIDKGYTVAFNQPFAGSLVPMRYFRQDKRVMSVMIEINRRLYMNDNGGKLKGKGYSQIKHCIGSVIKLLNSELRKD